MNATLQRVNFTLLFLVLLTSRTSFAQFGGGRAPAAADDHAAKAATTFRLAAKSDGQPPRPCKCIGEANSAVVKKIEMALSSPLHSEGLDYVEQPLNDVLNSLQKEYDIPFMLDAAALDANGIRPDEPITVNLHGISLKSALRHMLKNVQLTYLITDEVLLVTSRDEAEKHKQMCVYNVHDLVDTQNSESLAALAKVLSDSVNDLQPTSDGDNSTIRPVAPGTLIVTLNWSQHEMLRELLAALRECARSAAGPDSSHDPVGGSSSTNSAEATPTPNLAE